jgi:hypothetical protein
LAMGDGTSIWNSCHGFDFYQYTLGTEKADQYCTLGKLSSHIFDDR